MNQPELGKRIFELRKQKNLTQEALAEHCQLTVRSIQRIESGEVKPRLSSLKVLSEVLESDLGLKEEQDIKIWLVFLHLSNIIPVIIFPLVIWNLKKKDSPAIERQAKDVINFQLSMCLYLFSASFLIFVFIGIIILISLGCYISIISIYNTIKVSMDKDYKYPLTISFIK